MLKNLALSPKLVLAFALMGGVGVLTGGLVYRQVLKAEAAYGSAGASQARLAAARGLLQLLTDREAERALAEVETAPTAAAPAARKTAANPFAALPENAERDASVSRDLSALRDSAADPADLARINRVAALDEDARRAGAPSQLDAMRPLLSTIATDAEAAAVRDENQATQALSAIRPILLAGMGVSLALAALLWLLLERDVARSLRSTARALTRLADGESEVQLDAVGRGDEIGAMAGAVDAFRRNLERNRTLEAQAKEAEVKARDEAARTDAEREAYLGEQTHVVDTLQAALNKLSAGDLTCRIETEFPGRYAQIREEFNTALAHMHDMVGRVTASVASITNGTNEIGQAADDLSRRTEQQAASLDKTAAALDEITATVKHSAENAVSVASSVAAARLDTERSGEVMREAVAAMTSIQKSSQQIARIIGVIDEIAFQTNLLALNAGVEAARAGDAGRGFAVVALEVRALAQRSSEAAKEIKSLIGASSAHVGDGVDLVNRSGEVLMRIAAQVTQIDALVQEIAGSAREQSIGIADVNDAVNKMDRVTQQNAAMVEETTAATLSLRTETEELCRLLATFQTGEGDASVARLKALSAAMHTAVAKTAAKAAASDAMPAPRPAVVAVAAVATAAAPATAAAEDLGWEEF